MNREQTIAWLTLEGYEPVIFSYQGEVANHAARHTERPALSLDGPEGMALRDMDIGVGGSGSIWFTENDIPSTWDIFSDVQLARVFEIASTWDGEQYEP